MVRLISNAKTFKYHAEILFDDVLENGQTMQLAGAVVDALDTAALAAALQRVLADPVQARAMGRRARQAIEPYSLSRMTDDYLALYNRLLAAPHETAA